MGRIYTFLAIAFLAGLAVGLFGRSVRVWAMPETDAHAADLAAIEKLHQADEEASLKQDPTYLEKLWAEDCIKVDGPTRAEGLSPKFR